MMAVAEHAARYGRTDDLLIGLQLTHSGRFARPDADNRLKPAILYPHPFLNKITPTTAQQNPPGVDFPADAVPGNTERRQYPINP